MSRSLFLEPVSQWMLKFLEIAPMDSMFDYFSRLIDFLPLAHYLSQQIPRIFIFLFFSPYPLFYLFFMLSRLINNSHLVVILGSILYLTGIMTHKQTMQAHTAKLLFMCVCTDHRSVCMYIQRGERQFPNGRDAKYGARG